MARRFSNRLPIINFYYQAHDPNSQPLTDGSSEVGEYVDRAAGGAYKKNAARQEKAMGFLDARAAEKADEESPGRSESQ